MTVVETGQSFNPPLRDRLWAALTFRKPPEQPVVDPNLPFDERWAFAESLPISQQALFVQQELQRLAIYNATLTKVPHPERARRGTIVITKDELKLGNLLPDIKEPLLRYLFYRTVKQDQVLRGTSKGDISWGKPEIRLTIETNRHPFNGISLQVGRDYTVTGNFEGFGLNAHPWPWSQASTVVHSQYGIPVFQEKTINEALGESLKTNTSWVITRELVRFAHEVISARAQTPPSPATA